MLKRRIELAASDESAVSFMSALALMIYPYLFQDTKSPEGLEEAIHKGSECAGELCVTTVWNRLVRLCPKDGAEFFNGYQDIKFEEVMNQLGDLMKPKRLATNRNLTHSDIRFINAWGSFLRNKSDSSKATYISLIKALPANVRKFYAPESFGLGKNQTTALEEVRVLTAKMFGKAFDVLNLEQAKIARDKYPEEYQEYLVARRKVNSITKTFIQKISRQAGKPVDVAVMRKDLEKAGILHTIPKGLVGKMDDVGFYTVFGEKLAGTPVGTVTMNPEYTEGSSSYVLKYQAPGAKTWQNLYTEEAKHTTSQAKYARVANSIPKIKEAKKIWTKDIRSKDEELQECAVICEIMYHAQGRIGTKGNKTDGKATFGISTLIGDHCTWKGDDLILTYIGKKGAKQKHYLSYTGDTSLKRAIDWMEDRLDDMETQKEKVFSVTAAQVNHYIKTRLNLAITAHGFRTMRGTVLMGTLLDECPINPKARRPKDYDKRVIAYFDDCAKKVGAILGHSNKTPGANGRMLSVITGATACASYIDPDVIINFFSRLDVRPPARIETVLKNNGKLE